MTTKKVTIIVSLNYTFVGCNLKKFKKTYDERDRNKVRDRERERERYTYTKCKY